VKASRPPAEAPMPTIGKREVGSTWSSEAGVVSSMVGRARMHKAVSKAQVFYPTIRGVDRKRPQTGRLRPTWTSRASTPGKQCDLLSSWFGRMAARSEHGGAWSADQRCLPAPHVRLVDQRTALDLGLVQPARRVPVTSTYSLLPVVGSKRTSINFPLVGSMKRSPVGSQESWALLPRGR
jgi:hypothetical protein